MMTNRCREVLVSENPASPRSDAQEDLMARVDTSVPVSARIWNYWMGGSDYYPVDKAAGDAYATLSPGVFELASSARAFLVRAVRYTAPDLGVRQFLDCGSGLPSHSPTHEVAQGAAPGSRVVYVDHDPLVLAHARTKLDFSQPIAIMLMGVMGHIGDPFQDDDRVGRSIVEAMKDALPSGGYFVMYEGINTDPAQNEALAAYNASGAIPYYVREPAQVLRFFEGLELVDPGVVPIHQWHPDLGTVDPPAVPALGGIGRKP